MGSTLEPDLLCVRTHWRDELALQKWMASPLRAAQARDLPHYLAPGTEPQVLTFVGLHQVASPAASLT